MNTGDFGFMFGNPSDSAAQDTRVRCWMCDARYFTYSHRPARREWRLFGIVLRRYRPAVLLMTCKCCGAVNEKRPGTVKAD